MNDEKISAVFLSRAAGILGDTSRGASGQDIVTIASAYAVDGGVQLPHPSYPLEKSKRTALYENLEALPAKAAYQALLELCDNVNDRFPNTATNLKMRLIAQYGHLSDLSSERSVSHGLIAGTLQWLELYPDARSLFTDALAKYEAGIFNRNCLDDLRLALETLVRLVLGNDKTASYHL